MRSPVALDQRVCTTQLDLDDPSASLPAADGWDLWRVLVKVNDRPVGEVLVDPAEAERDPAGLRRRIRCELAAELQRSAAADRPRGTAGRPRSSPRADGRGDPSASVIIATRDRPDQLRDCLGSVLDLDHPDFEVVVVDNAPSDRRTADLVAELATQDRGLRYVCEPRPGLAVAHNTGLRHARGDVLAFTDDDVQVDRSWLRRIVDAFDQHPEAAAVTGLILPIRLTTPAQHRLEQYARFAKGYRRRVFDLGANRPDDPLFPYTIGTVGSGANMAFRRNHLIEVGGFDPALGAGTPARGGDDLAAFFDVIRRGGQVVYEPAAIVLHEHHAGEDALRRQLHGYGVGFTAFLTSAVLADPRHLVAITRRAVPALRHLLSSSSAKNAGKDRDFPADLTRLERRGMVEGPFRYVQSRLQARRHRRRGEVLR